MIEFVDGPAAGEVLALRRAPMFLRLVQSPVGEWDALDQLDDVPAPEEKLCLYLRMSPPMMVHVDTTEGGRRRGTWYVSSEYRHFESPPDDAIMRDTAMWRQWCIANRKLAGAAS